MQGQSSHSRPQDKWAWNPSNNRVKEPLQRAALSKWGASIEHKVYNIALMISLSKVVDAVSSHLVNRFTVPAGPLLPTTPQKYEVRRLHARGTTDAVLYRLYNMYSAIYAAEASAPVY
jgi:hypothetical protein